MTNQYVLPPISSDTQPVIRQSIGFTAVGLLVSGFLYCCIQVGIAQVTFPDQANGSMVLNKGQIVGSSLVAQKFQSAAYFHSRPSAIDYNPMSLGGSNMAVSNPALQHLIQERKTKFAESNGISPDDAPLEMITASGSGIDPDISPRSAQLQAQRIANARGIDKERILSLIQTHTQSKQFGVFGQARVNVLMLNLALDRL